MWKFSNAPAASVKRKSLKIMEPWEEENFEKTGRNQLAIYKGKKNCRWKISRDVSCPWSEGDINSAKVKGNSRPTIHSKIPSDAGPFVAWGRMVKPQAKWSRRETLSLVTHFARALLMEPPTNGPFCYIAFVSHFRPCDVLMGIFFFAFFISYEHLHVHEMTMISMS